jgi:hypothetical protein
VVVLVLQTTPTKAQTVQIQFLAPQHQLVVAAVVQQQV